MGCSFSLFIRYGDFVPTTNTSKVVMMLWVLIGLTTMGVITGVISSGMTVGDQEEEIKLYGTKVCNFAKIAKIRKNCEN